jgi:gas vesicle protein
MFWTGFLVGLFIGASVGVLVAALLFMSRLREKAHERSAAHWPEK